MHVRKILGVLGSSLLAVGSLLSFPGAANAAALTVIIDCSVNEDVDVLMRAGDTLTITTVNCEEGIDEASIDDPSLYSLDLATVTSDITGGTPLVVSSPDEPGVGINDWIVFRGSGSYIELDIDLIPVVPDPSGVLITTGDASIDGSTPPVLDFSEVDQPYDFDPQLGEHFVGGNFDECDVVAGMHEYGTLEFHVTEAGEYTFRVVDVDPADPDVDDSAATSYPTTDPYLALYSDFDSANPDNNVVGCNDDRDFRSYNSEDVLLDRQWSEFVADLEPGNYTLVYTSWNTFDDWAAETGGLDQTVTFEFWGPEGGLTLGALAETGTNAVTPLNGLGFMLILAGAGLLIARRVRTN